MGKKIEDFGQELVDVVVEVKRSKEDGHIGIVDLWRIGREIKDVIVLLPTIKDFPDELADMSDAQIENLVRDMYLFVQQSDGPNLDRTIDEGDVIHALKGIKHFAMI